MTPAEIVNVHRNHQFLHLDCHLPLEARKSLEVGFVLYKCECPTPLETVRMYLQSLPLELS